ncbi:MAG: hypothetical protein KDK36_18705 [Leptospiraceae bacterium]|nr:hypothetical protein [Leptospiraceae bacterium]
MPKVLPVIHVETYEQCARNLKISYDSGADGVFLINHSIRYNELKEIYGKIRKEYPEFWIGINFLDLRPWQVIEVIDKDVSAIWVDNAYINERADVQEKAEEIKTAREKSKCKGTYFGGVAFKYTREVKELEKAAKIAENYVDVITTSGIGTGQPAELVKIKRIKQGLTSKPLAIASGITPDNVMNYLDFTEYFLVATGISDSFTELNPGLLGRLLEVVRGKEGITLFRCKLNDTANCHSRSFIERCGELSRTMKFIANAINFVSKCYRESLVVLNYLL